MDLFEFGPIDIGILLLFLVSLLWVGVDCHANKVPVMDSKQYSSFAPFIWVAACVVFWIAFFPSYLVRRAGIKKQRASASSTPDVPNTDDRAIQCPHCGTHLLLSILVVGENNCPRCHGRFILQQ